MSPNPIHQAHIIASRELKCRAHVGPDHEDADSSHACVGGGHERMEHDVTLAARVRLLLRLRFESLVHSAANEGPHMPSLSWVCVCVCVDHGQTEPRGASAGMIWKRLSVVHCCRALRTASTTFRGELSYA